MCEHGTDVIVNVRLPAEQACQNVPRAEQVIDYAGILKASRAVLDAAAGSATP